LNVSNTRAGGTTLEVTQQRKDHDFISFDFDLDPAVVEIPHPADQPAGRGNATCKRPIADSLHMSTDEKPGAYALGWGAVGHCLKARSACVERVNDVYRVLVRIFSYLITRVTFFRCLRRCPTTMYAA
jgi:hypothetical protein